MLDSQKVSRLRREHGWEQKDLAEFADIHPSVISRLERGLQVDFKLSIVLRIARALGTSIDDLLQEPNSTDQQRFVPELNLALERLRFHSSDTQQWVAAMILGFLRAFERTNDGSSSC